MAQRTPEPAPFLIHERGTGYGSSAKTLKAARRKARQMRAHRDKPPILFSNPYDIYQLVEEEAPDAER